MFENKTEAEARKEILDLVAEYADKFHNQKKEFHEGDRIPYASRVYDSREMVNLVDSSLEFWLTSGRYTDEFEKKLAEYLHVRYCALVNSGSSANLIAFMTLTSPLLGGRRVKRGDEILYPPALPGRPWALLYLAYGGRAERQPMFTFTLPRFVQLPLL